MAESISGCRSYVGFRKASFDLSRAPIMPRGIPRLGRWVTRHSPVAVRSQQPPNEKAPTSSIC
jgi:hypothetical protein